MAEDKMNLSQGCLDIWIDDLVPCLLDTETGELKARKLLEVYTYEWNGEP